MSIVNQALSDRNYILLNKIFNRLSVKSGIPTRISGDVPAATEAGKYLNTLSGDVPAATEAGALA